MPYPDLGMMARNMMGVAQPAQMQGQIDPRTLQLLMQMQGNQPGTLPPMYPQSGSVGAISEDALANPPSALRPGLGTTNRVPLPKARPQRSGGFGGPGRALDETPSYLKRIPGPGP